MPAKFSSIDTQSIRTIVISRPDRIGDVVLSSSCLNPVRKAWPNAKIYFLIQSPICPLFSNHPDLDGVIPLIRTDLPFLQKTLKTIQPDVLAHLHFDSDIETIARAVPIPHIFGIRHLDKIKKRCERQEADYNFDVLMSIGVKRPLEYKASLSLDTRAQEIFEKAFPELSNIPYAAIHMMGFEGKPSLDPQAFAAIANYIYQKYGFTIVLVGKESDHSAIPIFKSHYHGPMVDTINRLSLIETAWLLKASKFALGRDSGIAHLAAALDTPTCTIIGPTGKVISDIRWKPLGSKSVFMTYSMRPQHFESTQQFQKRYFREIPLKSILETIDSMLEREYTIPFSG